MMLKSVGYAPLFLLPTGVGQRVLSRSGFSEL